MKPSACFSCVALLGLTLSLNGATLHYTFSGIQYTGGPTPVGEPPPTPVPGGAVGYGSFTITINEGDWDNISMPRAEDLLSSFNLSLSNLPEMDGVTVNYTLADFTGGNNDNIHIVRFNGDFLYFTFGTRWKFGFPNFPYPGNVSLSQSSNLESGFQRLDENGMFVLDSGWMHWTTPTVTQIPEPSAFAVLLGGAALVFGVIQQRRPAGRRNTRSL